jgi:hypothetical protein
LQELNQKLRDQSWELGHIEDENKQIKQLNQQLMEEMESYQRLIEDKTNNGDILSSSLLQRSLSRSSGISLQQQLSASATRHQEEEDEEDDGLSLLDDIKALALYVSRFVSGDSSPKNRHYVLPQV